MITRWRRACQAIESGATSPAEVRRVLGLGEVACQDDGIVIGRTKFTPFA